MNESELLHTDLALCNSTMRSEGLAVNPAAFGGMEGESGRRTACRCKLVHLITHLSKTSMSMADLSKEGVVPCSCNSQKQQPQRAIVLFIGATEVGLSSYPFFVCLSTRFQIIGACLGFLYTECRTRNNQFKLRQPRFRLDIRKRFLTVRAIHQRDQLPREVVGSPTLETFKKKLDSHLNGMV
ncbi:Stimulated by retinoic acid gene 6 protein-like [Varanus komodoensis]|nr:Stimulated by retinoic acid gene 6 protein-like [Varanus komodoensis]